MEKSEDKTEFATNEKEVWKSASKGTKVTFLGDNETFAAAYPDCPNSYNFVYITKEDGKTAVYFRATCVLNDSQDAKGNLPDDCSVRCVR